MRSFAVTRWPLWGLPGVLLTSVLAVEVVAVVLVGTGLLARELVGAEAWHFGAVVGLGLLHNEVAHGIERIRRRVDAGVHVNMSSVWFFAGVVLLPPAWAALGAAVVHVHMYFRSVRPRVPLFKEMFNACNVALSCLAAGVVLDQFSAGLADGGTPEFNLPAIALAMLVYFTINSALVGGVIAMHAPGSSAAEIVGDWQENLLLLATLSLGSLTALVVLVNPWMVLFVLPSLLVLHRAVLVRQLEEAASRDAKTGLLNAAAWHNLAERELRRAERREGPRAVLVVDLDHFKSVNDTYGHLAGDQVLAAVAEALTGEVRDGDIVGRFGGEEFVVMLGGLGEPGEGQARLEAVAERIRNRISTLRVEMPTPDGPLTVAGLSASVGGALYPVHGGDLRTLLHVAETALYAAKRSGRNAVRTGRQELPPVPPSPQRVAVHPAAEPPSAPM